MAHSIFFSKALLCLNLIIFVRIDHFRRELNYVQAKEKGDLLIRQVLGMSLRPLPVKANALIIEGVGRCSYPAVLFAPPFSLKIDEIAAKHNYAFEVPQKHKFSFQVNCYSPQST